MSEYYQGKYRIKSARAAWWDYSSNAAYFVTICTKDKVHYFGRVVNGQMRLSEIGRAADACWRAIPEHFPFVRLGAHIVMPNHTHGIVIIDKPTAVETQNFVSLHRDGPKNQFGPQSQNLASVIRGFKIGVTKNARAIQSHFAWQSRYHDHIIRDAQAYDNISRYIVNNPQKWYDDRFYRR